MAISRSSSPRPSSQSCSLVSHCTSSPNRLRRGRHICTCSILCLRGLHSLASIIHFRTVSRLASTSCRSFRYSVASVGLNPRYTSCDRIATARCCFSFPSLRFEGAPRNACNTALSPLFLSLFSSRRTCRSVIPNSSAASFCVINFFLAFFNATSRSRSAWFISSCPCCTSPAWRLSIGHFYFALIGHSHFAPTLWHFGLTRYTADEIIQPLN